MPYGDNCSPRRAEPIPSAISRVRSGSRRGNPIWVVGFSVAASCVRGSGERAVVMALFQSRPPFFDSRTAESDGNNV